MDNKHERLADRFADIFMRLSSHEKLDTHELAAEYQVSDKTIRRDLLRMERYLPLVRKPKMVYLDKSKQFNLSEKEFGELIRLIGVHRLIPNMDIQFLRDMLKQNTRQLQIAGYEYENIEPFFDIIPLIKSAIAEQQIIRLDYKNQTRLVHPYKLLNHRGCWYLIGTQNNEIKTFRLSKILNLSVLQGQSFVPDDEIWQLIDQGQGIWFGHQLTNVLIKTDEYARGYFLQKQILPNQKIIKSLEDGGLLIQYSVYQKQQIFPMIRSWIPHLTIIEPAEWRDYLNHQLKKYLNYLTEC
jgi:deoR-like transcriptional regulator